MLHLTVTQLPWLYLISLWYQQVYSLWFWTCSPPSLHSHLCCVSHISAALAAVMITEPTRPGRPASSSPSSLPWREPLPHCSLSLSVSFSSRTPEGLFSCSVTLQFELLQLSLSTFRERTSDFPPFGSGRAETIPQLLSVRLFLGVGGSCWMFVEKHEAFYLSSDVMWWTLNTLSSIHPQINNHDITWPPGGKHLTYCYWRC